MKSIRFCLVLGLVALSILYCSKKNNVTGNDGDKTGNNITVNKTEFNLYGIDSLYVSPNDTMQLQAATVAFLKPPDYQWSVANASIFQLVYNTGDSSKVNVVAVGDSGATTTITVKDIANNQEKTISAKVAVWADLEKFRYAGTLNRHFYFISKFVADWAPAEATCEDSHGHLVAITSKEENDMVKSARTLVGKDVWIGLYYQWDRTSKDRSKDKKWTEWVTGEKVTYTNWTSGRPDYTPNDYDNTTLVYMDALGKWWNEEFRSKYYVLEIP
jgi:hypothetical protein